MAAGTDGEETFEEGYGTASELAVQAEESVPDGGPRREERKEEKGKRKVAMVTTVFAGKLDQESERCRRKQRRHQ